jgi:tryptophan 2,3-dioxygenase
MRALDQWMTRPEPSAFPFREVQAEFHRVGKHFAPVSLLQRLDEARRLLTATGPVTSSGLDKNAPDVMERVFLQRFLDVCLDKWDGRYDYHSYLGLDLLDLPGGCDPEKAARRSDRLVVLLTAAVLGFELEAAAGRTAFLPERRPAADVTLKRCRLGLRAAGPAVRRLGLLVEVDPGRGGGPEQAEHLVRAAQALGRPEELRAVQASMLPVHQVHDEHLFIRVLQLFESAFALLAVRLEAAVTALRDSSGSVAADHLSVGSRHLKEAAPLFSLLATMHVDAFRDFRRFTEGASAIQSRNYKIVESLCRPPESSRIDSAAYLSVPDVRQEVLAGRPSLQEELDRAEHEDRLDTEERDQVLAAMGELAERLGQWRQTHYRLAVRMLGERRGTGYTEGTPYLDVARSVPVFTRKPPPDPVT